MHWIAQKMYKVYKCLFFSFAWLCPCLIRLDTEQQIYWC